MNDGDGHFGESVAAQVARLELREGWVGWKHEPFTSESRPHVSVWEKLEGSRSA